MIEANLRALAQRPVPGALDRYTEVARRLTGDPAATAEDGLDLGPRLCTELAIPPLRASGLTRSDFAHVIPAAQRPAACKAIR